MNCSPTQSADPGNQGAHVLKMAQKQEMSYWFHTHWRVSTETHPHSVRLASQKATSSRKRGGLEKPHPSVGIMKKLVCLRPKTEKSPLRMYNLGRFGV